MRCNRRCWGARCNSERVHFGINRNAKLGSAPGFGCRNVAPRWVSSIRATCSRSRTSPFRFRRATALYRMQADPSEDFAINLGAMAARGERGTLIVSLDFVSRTASNPFFPYLLQRIESGIGTVHDDVPHLP
jgi:hypothetical protein